MLLLLLFLPVAGSFGCLAGSLCVGRCQAACSSVRLDCIQLLERQSHEWELQLAAASNSFLLFVAVVGVVFGLLFCELA